MIINVESINRGQKFVFDRRNNKDEIFVEESSLDSRCFVISYNVYTIDNEKVINKEDYTFLVAPDEKGLLTVRDTPWMHEAHTCFQILSAAQSQLLQAERNRKAQKTGWLKSTVGIPGEYTSPLMWLSVNGDNEKFNGRIPGRLGSIIGAFEDYTASYATGHRSSRN